MLLLSRRGMCLLLCSKPKVPLSSGDALHWCMLGSLGKIELLRESDSCSLLLRRLVGWLMTQTRQRLCLTVRSFLSLCLWRSQMIPSLVIWLLDRSIRLLRCILLHCDLMESGKRGFRAAEASAQVFPDSENGDVVRLDFELPQKGSWAIGQHFYLCFIEGSVWQSHPMTPFLHPQPVNGTVRHSYLFRAKKGETKKVAQLISKKLNNVGISQDRTESATTGVILTGPYGQNLSREICSEDNNLFFAGGSGVTFVLPVIFHLIRNKLTVSSNIELVWIIRKKGDFNWISSELDQIAASGIIVRIYVTREPIQHASSSLASLEPEEALINRASLSNFTSKKDSAPLRISIQQLGAENRHPDLKSLIESFVQTTGSGPTTVIACGPGNMVSDLRRAVADCNDGTKVWKGEQQFNVRLLTDNRLE